jgi:hypothetical protein
MYAHNKCAQIGDQLGKGFAQRVPSSDKHIVMVGDKVTHTCCHSGAKSSFNAIAFRGIAGFLGDGEADARLRLIDRNDLQPKRRAPGAIAPGSPLELGTLDQPTQGVRLLFNGRHPARTP